MKAFVALCAVMAATALIGLVFLAVLAAGALLILAGLVAGIIALVKRYRAKPAVAPVVEDDWIVSRREIVENLPPSIRRDFVTTRVPLPVPRAYTRADASGSGPWPFV